MPNENEGEQLLNAITRHVFLVMLHISWPKMSYQIADAIVEVKVEGEGKEKKKEVAEEFRTKPQWQLMPEEWRKKLVNLEGRARSLLGHASVNFAARGVSVLPVSRAQEIFSGLRALRAEMNQYRDEFVEEYEGILKELEDKLEKDLYKKVQGKLPRATEVASKFGITWAIIPAGGRGFATNADLETLERPLSGSTDPAAAEALEVIRRLREQQETATVTDDEANELIAEAQGQMHSLTQKMLRDMSEQPRRVLLDAADNLIEALRDPERIVRNGTISQVREAFELIEGFEFLAGPDLLQAMRDCRERLDDATPRQLNSDPEVGAALAAGLRGVREQAADAQQASTAMRNFRGIRLRERPREEVNA